MESLGNLPEYIIPKRSEHITNITINNFKKFQNLNIQNLGLINLIVGDNNIGKTSLLEAFLFTEDKKDYLKRLAFAYIDRRNIATDKEEVNGQVTHFYNMNEDFLIDFKSYNSQEFNLQFTFTKARNFWKYNVTQENKENEKGVQPIIFNESDYNVLHKLNLLDTLSSPFMPYGKGFGNDLAQAYSDEIGAKGRSAKKEFYERMKLFIPNIEEIDTDTKGGIFIYENTSDDKRNPLHQYGEGANKIFRILLLLSLHKGNRLMIDEIDAGIHYSRFKEFWKVILLIAKKDNTQIIATTHNEECINYFTEVLEELGSTYKEDARVIQCENVANQLRVRSYDFDNFSLAAELGIDIRGEAQL
jgi:AAA15 family ATPase/GTPase